MVRVRQLIVAVALLAAAATAAHAQGRRTEELMRKSGLWDQVAQMHAQMRVGVMLARDDARQRGSPMLDDASFARLNGAIDRAFARDVLRETVALQMEELLAAADEAEVLRWLSSELGARFTRWEVEAGTVAEPKRAEESAKLVAALTPARRAKYVRLGQALDAGNTVVTLTIGVTTAIVYGIALVTPGTDADVAANGIRSRMESQRPAMVQQFAERSVQTYSYVYRNATDAQVEAYVRFVETPAARRYHAAGVKALDDAISQAAILMGKDLGAPAPPQRNPS